MSCLPCPAGFTSAPGSNSCIACRPGYFASSAASGSCTLCPLGMQCPTMATRWVLTQVAPNCALDRLLHREGMRFAPSMASCAMV